MASRKLEDLHPKLQQLAEEFKIETKKVGLDVIFTCTARLFKEQVALYAQGRHELGEVNALRLAAGMQPILESENARPVTWTLASRHIIDLDDDREDNNKATALDFAVVYKGIALYDIKANVNNDDIPDYLECGEIGEKLGLEWGGRWKTPDYPHLQLPKSLI